MLKKSILKAAACAACACTFMFATGCGSTETATPKQEGPMKVVATTTMLSDLSKEIGGDKVKVEGLMKAGVDPHLYQASAGDVERMKNADIVVYNGVHLEGKMDDIFKNLKEQNKATVRVSDALDTQKLLDFEEDGEKVKDPHIWFSVKNWKAAAEETAKGFSKKDPANKDYYESRLKTYLGKLDELDKHIRDNVQTIPSDSRVLVTAHDAFGYFANEYGFTVKGIQGVSTATEAGTFDISELADFIVTHHIKSIFVESSVPHKTIEALQDAVRARGHEVSIGGELFSDSLGEEGTPEGTYIGMYKHNIKTITDALK